MKFLRILIALFSLVLPAERAAAKCSFIKYAVTGRISAPGGIPRGTVRIYLFLEDASRTSDYPPATGERDYSEMNGDGLFSVVSWYHTAKPSQSSSHDDCSRVARTGSLIVIADGLQAKRVEVSFKESRSAIKQAGQVSLDIGEVRLERSSDP